MGYERKDNTPMTLGDLIGIVLQEREATFKKKNGKEAWEKKKALPIQLSIDEEGNGFGHLWSVDIAKNGQLTLWPAGEITIP